MSKRVNYSFLDLFTVRQQIKAWDELITCPPAIALKDQVADRSCLILLRCAETHWRPTIGTHRSTNKGLDGLFLQETRSFCQQAGAHSDLSATGAWIMAAAGDDKQRPRSGISSLSTGLSNAGYAGLRSD
jgi:hypothetical protein